MKVLRTTTELVAWRSAIQPGQRIAFVPTMGYLHEGHLQLVAFARRRVAASGGVTVVSIFVNPTQFGPREDLDRYPRDEAGDLVKAEAAGVDVVFCPSPEQMYPSRLTWVEVEGLSGPLCGRSRPGHFRGVCTVVTKLWNLVRPDIAVFGNKDYQQLAILRRMHSDLFLSGEIVGHPIVREPDGLAMSSRNANLSPSGRTQALAIFRFLHEVERRFSNGERQAERLLADADRLLHPGSIDYVELVDADDLSVVTTVERASLCAVAVFFEGVRLLDNVVLHP